MALSGTLRVSDRVSVCVLRTFATGILNPIKIMEVKIDNLTQLLDKVVNDLSSVKNTLSVHEQAINGRVDGSSQIGQNVGDNAVNVSSVADRVSSVYNLGAGSVFSPQAGPGPAGYTAHEESTSGSSTSSNDELQMQYKAVKDSVQRVRLPPGLKLETSLRGVGQQFNKTARVIHAAADYSETLLKLLLTIDTSKDPITISDDLVDCLVVAVTAQVRYLQSEKSVCFISGRFGEEVGNLFREFKTHASSLSASDIGVLENVIQLSAARQQQPRGRGFQGQRRPYNNYRGRSNFARRGGHNSQFGSRSYQADDSGEAPRP